MVGSWVSNIGFPDCCGILKLICDDNNVKFSDFIFNTRNYTGTICNVSNYFTKGIANIIKICGQDFLSKVIEP